MQITRRTLLGSTSAMILIGTPRLAWGKAPKLDLPPPASVKRVTDDIFGTKVVDPYRWMETANSQEFSDYLRTEGAYARALLDRIPGRDALAASIARYSGDLFVARSPQAAGPYIFLQVRPSGANTYKLQVRPLAGGPVRILIDPDTAGDGKKHALNYWLPSPDGSHVVFGISESGSEDAIIQVIETATGKLLSDRIDRVQYASPSWRADGKGFYFNRLASADKTSVDYYKRSVCWFHALGTDAASDVRVLAQGAYPGVSIDDIEFPVVMVTQGSETAVAALIAGVQNELTLYTAPAAMLGRSGTAWTPVCKPADKITNLTQRGDELYLLTYADAPRYKLLRTSASRPELARATLAVPESDMVIDNVVAARDGIYLLGKSGGTGALRKLGNDGRLVTIDLPFAGTVSEGSADPRADGLWFLLEGWTDPPQVCHVDGDGRAMATDFAPRPPYPTDVYASELIQAVAGDGTRIPLSVIYRKGLKRDGSAPAMIEAYGSYGISNDPSFSTRELAWLDAGGIYAIAHVRGGGELGRAWYEAGKKATKPNTWRDLIACAEKLIEDRWTSKGKIAIQGTSAGGITVGMALTERPDLFAVVISRVGVSNAARAEFSPNGPPNVPEFGSVLDRGTAASLLAMDALSHVDDRTAYPSVIFTTGLTDPRVSPWQPGKMAARLRAATSSANPILLRVEEEGGHGLGSTRSQFDQEFADLYAFALWRMGDPRYQP